MDLTNSSEVERALATLGEVLQHRAQRADVVLIGGSALILLGLQVRATKDVDVVALHHRGKLVSAEPLPEPLREAAAAVAHDLGLTPNWLNPGPTSLLQLGLPRGFLGRCIVREFGALQAHVAGRYDQIHFKLYAAVDQGPRSKHRTDLEALAPTRDELIAAGRWCRTHDPSPGFLHGLTQLLAQLGAEVSDEEL